MYNSLQTGDYEGMIAETITVTGYKGDRVNAYYARPMGAGPYPGVVLIAHMPGWDEFYRETARRFAQHGYMALCPDIYQRFGQATPSEVAAKAREAGGVPDISVMEDCKGSLNYLKSLPNANGKVGVIGTCSGGRHAYLAACTVEGFDAVVDCWGGGVVMAKEDLTENRPVAPIDYTQNLNIPLLGIFGNEDRSPTAEQVNIHEAELKKHNKDYEFHRYDDAGHGFWYYQSNAYRPAQAMDAWDKTFDFFEKHLRK
jgi:carboxymethylenebutenolidase